MTNERLFFFEQTDFSLRFARCVISETALSVEELKELPLDDQAGLSQLAPAGTPVVCALRPKPRQLRLTTAEEGRLHAGPAGLRQFVRLPEFASAEPAWLAACQATDGTAPGATPSLLSLSSATAQQQSRQLFEALKLKPARCLDATLASVGAFAASVGGPFLLLEIGELSSHALLVVNGKVLAVRKVGLSLDQIAEAVRLELHLNFRGAAAKLFFNPDCDFSEAGQKVCGRVAESLKSELAPLLTGQSSPVALCCSGLPAAQHWFEVELGKALGLALHEPDGRTWSASVGLSFASPSLATSLVPSWFNFLHFINSQTLESAEGSVWQAEWQSLDQAPAPQPAKPAPTPATVPAGGNSAKSAASPAVSSPAPKPAPAPAKPAPAAKPAPTAAPKSAAKPTPPPPAAAAPAPAKAAPSSLHYSTQPAKTERSTTDTGPAKKNKLPLFAGIGILLLALLGGYFFLESRNAEIARIALEKKQTEERLKAEQTRAQLAEQQAQAEAENRKKFEFETSHKLAQAEAARQQAEAEARNQTAFRLANARGTLVVTTEPAGALVTVGDLPAKPSPATFALIKIGKYPITLTLAHHEEVKLEAEVTENNTTETGPITLPSLVGSLVLTSEPAGSKYEVRPANTFSLTDSAHRTGQTPATIEDLKAGDYTVTFTRAGWDPHTETITVGRNTNARVAWTFPNGTLRITSSPAGATVMRDGVQLGSTPLTASLPPGPARFEVGLEGFDPVVLPGRIAAGATLELSAQFPESQRIYQVEAVDRRPEPTKSIKPELPYYLTLANGRVEIEVVVTSDGGTRNPKVLSATEADLTKYCLAALAEWKFKPGLKAGKPVNTRMTIPFVITAKKS